jgi:hypothetical protein
MSMCAACVCDICLFCLSNLKQPLATFSHLQPLTFSYLEPRGVPLVGASTSSKLTNGSESGAELRNYVEKKMTPANINAPQKLARECVRKKYKDCRVAPLRKSPALPSDLTSPLFLRTPCARLVKGCRKPAGAGQPAIGCCPAYRPLPTSPGSP